MSLSHCGRYVATGSSGARESSIHVWESAPGDEVSVFIYRNFGALEV